MVTTYLYELAITAFVMTNYNQIIILYVN